MSTLGQGRSRVLKLALERAIVRSARVGGHRAAGGHDYTQHIYRARLWVSIWPRGPAYANTLRTAAAVAKIMRRILKTWGQQPSSGTVRAAETENTASTDTRTSGGLEQGINDRVASGHRHARRALCRPAQAREMTTGRSSEARRCAPRRCCDDVR